MGMPELIIILLVILVIFGPKNLPKLGSALGKAVKGVREGVDGLSGELQGGKPAAAADNGAPASVTAVVEDADTASDAQSSGDASTKS
jgi:sec-independent protein translocase protein TatA